jgi:hypothetical protein
MADKKLNEVTKVTDMAYVPVIMADGSIGQIAKADLASVVAGMMGNPLGNKTNTSKNLDNYKDVGIYDIVADSWRIGRNESCNWICLLPDGVLRTAPEAEEG